MGHAIHISCSPLLISAYKKQKLYIHMLHQRGKKRKKPKRDDIPADSELLDTLFSTAEFTATCKLGSFYVYTRLPHCRSPPLCFGFLKKIKTEGQNDTNQFAGLLSLLFC